MMQQTGGPNWEVPKGRKDGRISKASETIQMPFPTFNISQLQQSFSQRGLSLDDVAALSGMELNYQFSSTLYPFNPKNWRSYISLLKVATLWASPIVHHSRIESTTLMQPMTSILQCIRPLQQVYGASVLAKTKQRMQAPLWIHLQQLLTTHTISWFSGGRVFSLQIRLYSLPQRQKTWSQSLPAQKKLSTRPLQIPW